MKTRFIVPILLGCVLLMSCNKEVIGTYGFCEKEDLGKTSRLVLFEDYTFEHSYWTNLLKSDRGAWEFKSDTIMLYRSGHQDTLSLVYDNNKLYHMTGDGSKAESWEFKKTSRTTMRLLFE